MAFLADYAFIRLNLSLLDFRLALWVYSRMFIFFVYILFFLDAFLFVGVLFFFGCHFLLLLLLFAFISVPLFFLFSSLVFF